MDGDDEDGKADGDGVCVNAECEEWKGWASESVQAMRMCGTKSSSVCVNVGPRIYTSH